MVTGGAWPADARGHYVNFDPVEARCVRFAITAVGTLALDARGKGSIDFPADIDRMKAQKQ